MSKVFYKALGQTEIWPNLTGIYPSSLTYDDVLLVPQNSTISSRQTVNTTIEFGPYTLTRPVITAPMDTISGETMIRALASFGAIGTLPRGNLEVRNKLCKEFTKETIPCVYAIGLKNGMEEAKTLVKSGAKILLLDVAHGGLVSVIELAKEIKSRFKKIFLIAGNIVTYDEAKAYAESNSIDILRVGVGPGGLCKTRIVAGSGFPQLSAVFETESVGLPVIADGGVKHPADVAKAIAAGATIVMMGSQFAGTDETPGDYTLKGMKVARGQASSEYMKDSGIETSEFRSAEGISVEVAPRGPVKNVVDELMGGLRSAMSYAGAQNIKEFQKKAQFVYVSSAAKDEGHPWIKKIFV